MRLHVALCLGLISLQLYAAEPGATTRPLEADWFQFARQAAVPSYLRANQDVIIDQTGLHGGILRTIDADFINRDFTFEVIVEAAQDDRDRVFNSQDAVLGIGGHTREGNRIKDSVALRLHSDKVVLIQTEDGEEKEIPTANAVEPPPPATAPAKKPKRPVKKAPKVVMKPGPCVMRIEKKGKALTLSVCFAYAGEFKPDAIATIADLKAEAPFLNTGNASIFFWGSASRGKQTSFRAVRFSVDGKPAGIGPAAPVAAAREGPVDDASMFHFTETSGLPGYLKASSDALVGPGGLHGGEVRTLDTDFLQKDFTFDLVYTFKPDERAIFYVGIGENAHKGAGVVNSICSRVHGPGHRGITTLTLPQQHAEGMVGSIGDNPGPHVFRLQKRGNTLTMALCVNYKGSFEPTYSKTLPDFKSVSPFLDQNNSALFFSGDGTWQAVRLVVDGKIVSPDAKPSVAVRQVPAPGGKHPAKTPPEIPAAAAPPGASAGRAPEGLSGTEHLLRLNTGVLPAFIEPQRDLAFDANGLKIDGKQIRTVAANLVDKDFTFDVVYHFESRKQQILVVGLGENGRNGGWILNSVASRIHSAAHGGMVTLAISNQPESTIGNTGRDSDGPHLFRMRKKGTSLTCSVCINFKGTFQPDLTRTIPDLKSSAPFLTDKNSSLFISESGFIDALRFVVDGEPIESRDLALDLPTRAVAGTRLRQAVAKSADGLTFGLRSGPAGMAISPAGELTWIPGAQQAGRHDFVVSAKAPNKPAVLTYGQIIVISADDAKAAQGDVAKVDALYRLPLEGEKHELASGLDRASMLLLQGDELKRLEPDGLTVRQTVKLPHKYEKIAERAGYFIALGDESKSLDLIDKSTLRVLRTIQMDYPARFDLALHPSKPLSFVAVEKPGDGPRYVILIVDESSGDVREPEDFIGRWIKISPDGATLFASYKDIYQKGSRLLMNPDRWDVIPEYGNIDLLIAYDITTPRPHPRRIKKDAGANGFGLALSADGRRISYLSFTGYPLYSGNIPAWDPADFVKRPVTYPAKANRAGATKIAFHPVLPIAAAPTETGAVAFDRESGAVEPDRLDMRWPLGEVKVMDVIFSADGKNLILDCDAKGERFLRRVKLNLSERELEMLKHPPSVPAVLPPNPTGPRASVEESSTG